MLERQKFTTDHLRFAIENGEFHADIRKSAPLVACVMTQSWCPQWLFMRSWIKQLAREDGETEGLSIHTWETEYDREKLFTDFRSFKEQVWNNREVPYVRYYCGGKLVHESNFVSAMTFVDNFRQNN